MRQLGMFLLQLLGAGLVGLVLLGVLAIGGLR